MKSGLKFAAAVLLSASTCIGFAAMTEAPKALITHNKTNAQSNAYIDGTIPSPYPTDANSDGKVYWAMVKFACYGHTTDGTCRALIKMETNTSHAVDIGYVKMNLDTGDISPKTVSGSGYTINVNGPAEVTVTKD